MYEVLRTVDSVKHKGGVTYIKGHKCFRCVSMYTSVSYCLVTLELVVNHVTCLCCLVICDVCG
jgi:hypothetical protein